MPDDVYVDIEDPYETLEQRARHTKPWNHGKKGGKNLEEGENKEIFRQSQEYQLTLATYAQRSGIDHSSQQFDYCCRLGRLALCLAA